MTTSTTDASSVDRKEDLAALDAVGGCVVPDALSPDELEELRTRVDEVAAADVAGGCDDVYNNGCNQRIFSLLNKGACFIRMAEQPLALEFADRLLAPVDERGVAFAAAVTGPPYLLSNLDVNIAGPGGSPMCLYADQGFLPLPWAMPVVRNVAWMLDAFTEDNGATRVVLGSHLRDRTTPHQRMWPFPSATCGERTRVRGRPWHQTGANLTVSEKRRGEL